MLKRVEFTNYRGFKGSPQPYCMEGLARVNLIVGKNNSGKTALLEGIQFLASGGESSVLADIANRRGEVVISGPEHSPLVNLHHFFHGHEFSPGSPLLIKANAGDPSVEVCVDKIEKNKKKIDREFRSSLFSFTLTIIWDEGTNGISSVCGLTRDGIADDPAFGQRSSRLGIGRKSTRPANLFIGTDSSDYQTLASLWDEVTLSGLEEEVCDALRLLDSGIQSVHPLTGMSPNGFSAGRAGFVVGLKSKKARIPLGSLGEGMRRMLTLAMAIACVPGGFLFVDEIDTGLHYSVMTDMWKLVIKKAIASNIQVFATTHSWDCISGLAQICQLEPELSGEVAVHKIDKNIPRSIPFTGESLVGMVPNDIDPR